MSAKLVKPPTQNDKAIRALWEVVWWCAYRLSPPPLHGWRCMLLRLFGAKIGKGVHPYPSARIWAPWHLIMEDGSCLADGVDCYSVAKISIGRGSVVSQRSYLCAAGHDFRNPQFSLIAAPIRIGNDVWIAAEAFVGPGVCIGDRAVVGARAVVVKDVPAGSVSVGVPARVVGWRSVEQVS